MKKYLLLFLLVLFVPTMVNASEIDAIEQIETYKIERDIDLIESTNDVASAFVAIPTEEIKNENRFFETIDLLYILYTIPLAGVLVMYTMIIKAKEA